MNVEIKHKITGKVILSGAYASITDCLDKNRDADLRDADLSGADLRYANLRDADLEGAYLRDADLSDTYLSGADLRDADLRDADLSDADLRDADLSGADLRDADLSGADLRDADLSGAYLSGAGLYLQTEIWNILVTPTHIRIGCEFHTIEEWFRFDDEKIGNMDSKALDWWTKWKPILELMIAKQRIGVIEMSTNDDTCDNCGHVGLEFSRDMGNAGYFCGECGKFAQAEKVEDSGSEADFGTKDKQESWEEAFVTGYWNLWDNGNKTTDEMLSGMLEITKSILDEAGKV